MNGQLEAPRITPVEWPPPPPAPRKDAVVDRRPPEPEPDPEPELGSEYWIG